MGFSVIFPLLVLLTIIVFCYWTRRWWRISQLSNAPRSLIFIVKFLIFIWLSKTAIVENHERSQAAILWYICILVQLIRYFIAYLVIMSSTAFAFIIYFNNGIVIWVISSLLLTFLYFAHGCFIIYNRIQRGIALLTPLLDQVLFVLF